MRTLLRVRVIAIAVVILATGVITGIAYANHSWGGYHWARTSNPFTLKLGDNVSVVWDNHLASSSMDWSISSVLDTAIVSGNTSATKGKKTPKNCVPTSGRVEVCDSNYGSNGWLGVAQIWVSGLHITKGTVKLNDTYFNTATYNTPAWRKLVMCQEVGHTLGLDHQDEDFNNANLGTCMDYTNDPSTNQHPNQHDYDQLVTIYTHLDSTNTVTSSIDGGGKGKPANVGQDIDLNDPSVWGKAVKQDARGNNSLYERDLGNGEKVFTFVIWAK
ncbi:MAG TPA: hypothetical protein VJK04_01650 [Candidatus Paceibacterota bacterium]